MTYRLQFPAQFSLLLQGICYFIRRTNAIVLQRWRVRQSSVQILHSTL